MNNPVNPRESAIPGSLQKYEQGELLLEGGTFFWKTDLKPEAGEEFVRSPPFTYDSVVYPGSVFSILVKPNHVDKMGTRFLSAFLSMSGPVDQVLATFSIDLLTGILPEDFLSRSTGLVEFTRTSPSFGFHDYIPMYRLKETGNETYRFRLKLHTFGKNGSFQHNPDDKASMSGMDASLTIGEEAVAVNSAQISAHSQILKTYFESTPDKTVPANISFATTSKRAMDTIVRFCHSKILIFPNEPDEVANLMTAVKLLEMIELSAKCEELILKRLSVENFTSVVELACVECLSKEAEAVIQTFLIEHFEELQQRGDYRESFDNRTEYYQSRLLFESKNLYEDVEKDASPMQY